MDSENQMRRDFDLCPRYDKHDLTEDQMVDIAKRAVVMAKKEFNEEVGEAVTSKFFVMVGLCVMGILGWMTTNGYIK